jgi:hypothetical protein
MNVAILTQSKQLCDLSCICRFRRFTCFWRWRLHGEVLRPLEHLTTAFIYLSFMPQYLSFFYLFICLFICLFILNIKITYSNVFGSFGYIVVLRTIWPLQV